MLEVFKPYFQTAKNFLKFKNQTAYDLFNENNLQENFDRHDNWNGGVDYYTLSLRIPVSKFVEIEGAEEQQIANIIQNAIDIAIRDDETIVLNGVIIIPHDDATIFNSTSESMWNLDYFRLFISHVSENKESAKNLKSCLTKWGIHGFVAHEDIEPSREWASVLLDALFSMDALCAILVKKFRYSNWCDQEVGIALGLNKLCIPIHKESIPYGFLGRYQMLKSSGRDSNFVAKQVAECIYRDARTHNIYCSSLVRLLLNSKSIGEAKSWLETINHFNDMAKFHIEQIWKGYSHNTMLTQPSVLEEMNKLFKRYGLAQTLFTLETKSDINLDELPF